MFFDTHCHLDDKRYDGILDAVIENMQSEGVMEACVIGADINSSEKCLSLAEKYPFLYAVCGVHPSEVYDLDDKAFDRLTKMVKSEKCVAVGEIGLDYYSDDYDKDAQKFWFQKQLDLALGIEKPIVIHSRDACAYTMEILTKYQKLDGVFHCFSESVETMKRVLDLGLYIGIGGVLTFKNAKNIVEVAKACPLEKIVIETDCPYLTPHPYRGHTNTPAFIPLVAKKLAEIKNIPLSEVERVTTENAKKLYRL